jgi:hypothetical protein
VQKYLIADFKANTITKERCHKFLVGKKSELEPLCLECGRICSQQLPACPDKFLWAVVLSRKHGWKRHYIKKVAKKGS